MSNEEKYFSVLSGAITQVQTDSFEARGVVYDRLWNIILRRLQAGANASDDSIAREREAFLAAVKRIEFGERLPAALGRSEAPMPQKRPWRPTRWRIVGRMVSACALLLVVWFVYFVARLDSTSADRWINENPQSSWQSHFMRVVISVHNLFESQSPAVQRAQERAVLYEESVATSTGSTYSGHAFWAQQSQRKGAGTGFLTVEVNIPQKDLLLNLELRPAPDEGGVISHFVEFSFLTQNRTLSEAVQDVLGILMKNDELSPGIELTGKVIRVRPGVFLMGLSGAKADVERNLKLLRERPWLDIPIVFRGGPRSLLAIEKGTTGQNAINEVLRSAGQG